MAGGRLEGGPLIFGAQGRAFRDWVVSRAKQGKHKKRSSLWTEGDKFGSRHAEFCMPTGHPRVPAHALRFTRSPVKGNIDLVSGS